ncbi:MAG: CocE/NonD family hydrolase, partial [Saprospiraceae bacterium]
GISSRTNSQYMIEDQRFAAQRPDVLTFSTETLQEDLVLSGPINASLFITTTGTDADFIVKIIDELPDTASNLRSNLSFIQMAGFQRLVRAEVMRGKFRNSLERPEPFEPGRISKVNIKLNDVAHIFKKGHKIVVQVQSSWFPLVDRNPQKFMKIANAQKTDFKKSSIRLYRDAKHPSSIELTVLKN